MNYNDIQDRLKVLYASIDQQYLYHADALNTMHEKVSNGTYTISFYDSNDEPKVLNQINNVIANLANIKDCLKQILKARNDDPQVIESAINNSLHLQLIIDLANQERHGYPLKITRRSKKDPLIKNISRSLMTSNKPDNKVVKRSDGAAIQNMMASITADITESNGNLLCKLDVLVEKALDEWENIIKKNKII